jgi:DNA repair exonuclease SbcCD nuclease subunit
MRILFTADWHIKLGQKNVPIKWAIARYVEFFQQIKNYEQEVDLHIIGGDLFDRMPSLEELSLYFHFIKNITKPTVIYDGNHEATKKGKTFFSNLKSVTNSLNGNAQIVDFTYINPDKGYQILPYCKLHEQDAIERLDYSLPLFTHVRGEIPPHVKPEIDLDRFHKFPVVFAGDLHAHNNSQRNIVYPGSPMTTSFHRSKVETGCLIIEDNLEWSFARFKLPQLLRETVTDPSKMKATEYDHTIYELEGNLSDLSAIKASELLDKKVVKRKSESALILDKHMSIEEELVEYLTYILDIPEPKIQDIVRTFSDNTQKINLG